MKDDKTWKIVYYHHFYGQEPVYKFIESLDSNVQAKLSNTNLWELRILGADNIRIFISL